MTIQAFNIIESTLREGEQFVGANFSTAGKGAYRRAARRIRRRIHGSHVAGSVAGQPRRLSHNSQSRASNARVVTHTRCHMDDARLAVGTGVDGVDVLIGTSSVLRKFSHGMDIDAIIDRARDVVQYIKDAGLEVRFSTEDSFRSNLDDILKVYAAVDDLGVNRVGIADTVGMATPIQVMDVVTKVRETVSCDVEFHGHNDSGCAIANAYCALECGATHVDTSVLGIGERNGIASLGGLVARLYSCDRDLVRKYDLPMLSEIDNTVAELVGVDVPFNNYITGITAFTHKAGIHAKAVLNNPETYEILDPHDFGMSRYISIAHRLTGWNAIKARADQLNITLPETELRAATAHIKGLADEKPIGLDDVDAVLRNWINDHEGRLG